MTPRQIAEDFLAANPSCSLVVMSGQAFERNVPSRRRNPVSRSGVEYPQYVRHHIPSGHESVGFFSPGHIPGINTMPESALRQATLECIDKWNRNLPDTWSYRLA